MRTIPTPGRLARLLLMGLLLCGGMPLPAAEPAPVLDASDTLEIAHPLRLDPRTQRPAVPPVKVDPEVLRKVMARYFAIFAKAAVKVQKPTSPLPPPSEAPGNLFSLVGGAIGKVGATVGKTAGGVAKKLGDAVKR